MLLQMVSVADTELWICVKETNRDFTEEQFAQIDKILLQQKTFVSI